MAQLLAMNNAREDTTKDTLYPIEGQWYIDGPEKPAVFGVLAQRSGGGLALTVKILKIEDIASRFGRAASFFESRPTSRRIMGIDAKGVSITLYDCVIVRASSSGGLNEIVYRVGRGVIRGCNEPWERLTGTEFTLEFSLLHAWLSRTGIKPSIEDGEFGVSATRPEDLKFRVIPEMSLTLGAVLRSQHGRKGYDLSENSWLMLQFAQPALVSLVAQEYSYRLRLLFYLLTGHRTEIDGITYFTDAGTSQFGRPKVILEDYASRNVRRDLDGYNLRSRFEELNGRFGEVVAKWFEAHEDPDMKQVLALYSALTNHKFHISAKFVFLAQALEAYHAACGRYGSEEESADEFKSRLCRILRSVGDDNKDDARWLKRRLNNLKSFRSRLKEIISDAPPEVWRIIPDLDSFAALVVRNRNAYTHRYSATSHRQRLPEGHDLARLSHQMMHLLELLLLRDLGLEQLIPSLLRSFGAWNVATPMPEPEAAELDSACFI